MRAQRWPGQRLVFCAYLGMRFSTGGGCLASPVSVDGTGVREVIKGHSFRTREQAPPSSWGFCGSTGSRRGSGFATSSRLGWGNSAAFANANSRFARWRHGPRRDQDLRSPEENEVAVDMDIDAGAGDEDVGQAPEPRPAGIN